MYVYINNCRWWTNLCNVNFNQADVDIFITTELIPANPHLYVVSGCLRKLFAEPGWGVEFTAGTGKGTTIAIPDGVCGISLIWVGEKESPWITEIIISNKGGHTPGEVSITSRAGASPLVSSHFIVGSCKCPDVVFQGTMSDAYPIYVCGSNWTVSWIVIIEGICCALLVGSNPSTHSLVTSTISGIRDLWTSGTICKRPCSPKVSHCTLNT